LFSSLFRLFFVASVVAEDFCGLLFDPLILQVVKDALLFSNKASISLREVEDCLWNIFLCLFELQLGAIQGVPSAVEVSFHHVQVCFHVV
jgi:hypothetical protein